MFKYVKLNKDKSPQHRLDKTHSKHKDFENAGIMLNNKIVMVDFDNDNDHEAKLIKGCLLKYPTKTIKTKRGYHLYYSLPTKKKIAIKNKADVITLAGFQVDYKTGSTSYGVIKLEGKLREGFNELSLLGLPELPDIFYPLKKAKNITRFDEESGRNNALFEHLNYIVEQHPQANLKVAGEFINKYVLKASLEKRELANIVDSTIKHQKTKLGSYSGGVGDMFGFADFLSNYLDINIYYQQLFLKRKFGYTNSQIMLQKKANEHIRLRKNQFIELVHQLYNSAKYVSPTKNFRVMLKNGSIAEDKIVQINKGFSPFCLDVTEVMGAYDTDVDEFLDFISNGDKDLRTVIEEIIGHILMTSNFPHKIFFLIGGGNNGKSTFLEMINNFVGDLASHVDVANFDDGTSLVSLIGKLVNIADDVDSVYLEKSKNLKTMSSGNTVGARAIYSQPIQLKNTASLVFTSNEPPIFKDKSKGITRRLLIVPFTNVVQERDPEIDNKLSTEMAKSYLLRLGLAGIKRIIVNGNEMSKSRAVEIATSEYHVESDSVLSYIQSVGTLSSNPLNSSYEAYTSYCEDNHMLPVSLYKFIKRLSTSNYKVVNRKILGKKIKIIIKVVG